MQGEILLVNPRNSRGQFTKKRSKRRKHRARAANPRKRKHTARRKRAVGYTVGSSRVRRRKLNPRKRARRRNPRLSFGPSKIISALVPAAIGAGGAIGLDIALGAVRDKLPSALQSGPALTLVKVAGAFGLGMIAGMVKRDLAKPVVAGALTVVAYQTIRGLIPETVKAKVPGLSDFEDYDALGYVDPAAQLGAYMDSAPAAMPAPGIGAYMGVGEMSGYEDGM